MNDKLRIAMLISGGGTTMREILRAVKSGFLSRVEPVLVIASRADAGGISKAIEGGMANNDVLVMRPRWFESPEMFGEFVLDACHKRGVDFVGQYGWLPKTPENVIEAYAGMMTNQHPGPLDPGRPDFGGPGMYGRRVHCARLHFAKCVPDSNWTEATCQRVAPEFDNGTLLAFMVVPIEEGDTVETLQARVLPTEHALQIETLKAFSEGSVREYRRPVPLVDAEYYGILAEAKQAAAKEYPSG